jgi:L-ribulose-5-phosphate 3-epimerase
MRNPANRRTFLKTTAAAIATSAIAGANQSHLLAQESTPVTLKKAVKFGMVQGKLSVMEKFQLLKDIGFDGVEFSAPNGYDTKEVLAARDKTGLPIHGVVDSVHWKDSLSDPDPVVRQKGLDGLKSAIRTAKVYGATSVLLVPAVVSKEVAYHDAYERSHAAIKQAIPLAEENGIRILFENVWNNFLLSPVEMVRYIDEFESPVVGSYFDVGNVVRYGWPEHWIKALGKRIVKLDIKEYSRKLQMDQGPWKGFGVKIGDGDCDWPAVLTALSEVGYSGWATAEVSGGEKARLTEIHDRMSKAFGET